jgi:collagenase-like PrtC family protease
MGNVEYTSTGRKQLYEYLNWVYDIGADAVKVAIPLIIELVKKEFPDLEVHVSVNAHVDSVQKVKAFEELGADSINLDPMINRDFALLKRIRQVTRCEIELLVNQSCLYNCAYREYHNNIISHWSQDLGNKNVNICQHITCLVKKLTHPEELLKATWIRPEDLSIYECMGIDSFKIAGREKSASWILNCVAAYCRRSYRGNLTDLLVPDFSVFSVYEKYGKIDKPEIFVDNRLLTGFLETVSKRNCRVECGTDCKYCYTLARKVVVIKNKEKFVKFVQQIKDDLMHV